MRRFSSQRVTLQFGGALVTAGVMVGLVGLTGCAREAADIPPPLPGANAKVISQEQLARDLQEQKDEENNSYTPGLGYYHSIYHGWFPYPFNYFYLGRGYYRGGSWRDTRWSGPVPLRTQPNWSTVTNDKPGVVYDRSNLGGNFHSRTAAGGYEAGHAGGEVSRGGFTAPHSSGFHSGGVGHAGS